MLKLEAWLNFKYMDPSGWIQNYWHGKQCLQEGLYKGWICFFKKVIIPLVKAFYKLIYFILFIYLDVYANLSWKLLF